MATIGQALLTPDPGWTRFNDSYSLIMRVGTFEYAVVSGTYQGAHYGTKTVGSEWRFKFHGSAIRLMGTVQAPTECYMRIDGVEYPFTGQASPYQQVLVEASGLSAGPHEVVVGVKVDTYYLYLDAVDIQEGYISASVGTIITAPETGWQRYDDQHPAILKTGTWTTGVASVAYWPNGNGTYSTATTADSVLKFKFRGTKLRLITVMSSDRSTDVRISIDGVDQTPFSCNVVGTFGSVLVYEKLDMPWGVHEVIVQGGLSAYSIRNSLDALDIDADGELLTYQWQSLPTPEKGYKRIDSNSPQITYEGSWLTQTDAKHYGGSSTYTNTQGSKVKFKFKGTKLRIMNVAHLEVFRYNDLRITIDGKTETFSQVTTTGGQVYQAMCFDKVGLTDTVHEVEINLGAYVGTKYLEIDSIDIDDTGYMVAVPGQKLTVPDPGWQRIEETDGSLSYTGVWTKQSSANHSGGAMLYATAQGAKISFKFYGTKIRIITDMYTAGTSDTQSKITIDEVTDTFSQVVPAEVTRALNYEKTDLPLSIHTVTLEKGTASTNEAFRFDAIDIEDTGYMVRSLGTALPTPDIGWKRYDDTSGAFSFGPNWQSYTDAQAGGGSYRGNLIGTAKVEFDFVGTKLRIVLPANTTGSTQVTIKIDSVTETFSVNYAALFNTLVYEKIGLPQGKHKVSIQSGSTGYMWFDSIDIDASGRLLHPNEVTAVEELEVGKRIRCHYAAPVSGRAGWFSGLGVETANFIPVASATNPNGDFYFIVAENLKGEWVLCADRNVQVGASWDQYNLVGWASSTGAPLYSNAVDVFMSTATRDTSSIGVSSASSTAEGSTSARYQAWNAFDGLADDSGWVSVGTTPAWLEFNFNRARKICRYGFAGRPTALAACPKDFIFQAFDASANKWVDLDVRTGVGSPAAAYDYLYFTFYNDVEYNRYRLYMTASNSAATYFNIGELVMMEQVVEQGQAALRMPSGGVAAGDGDNEWDKYIARSTLNGTISASDNGVWNWSYGYSWTSSTIGTTGTNRIVRGYTPANASGVNSYASSTTTTTSSGFRPVLVLKIAAKPPVFEGSLDNTSVHHGDTTLSGIITDPEGKDVGYKISVNGQQVYPAEVGYTALAPSPLSIEYTVSNFLLQAGSNSVQLSMTNGKDIGNAAFSVTLTDVAPAISAKVEGSTLTMDITDPELDSVQYQILLNGVRVFPEGAQQFTELAASPVHFRTTFKSDQINIGTSNTIRIIAKDQFNATSSLDIPFEGTYAGLMFSDEFDRLYSTDLGKVLNLLDIGTLISGQTSLVYPIKLTNFTGGPVENIVIAKDMLANPLEIDLEMSYTETPFDPAHALLFPPVIQNNGNVLFYVRVVTQPVEEPSGSEFDITVQADPAD